jgi:hypothetical protein
MQQMPQLAAAPRLVREAITFPYFSGAEYMRRWVTTHPRDQQPYGDQMPKSSEEILDPSRAANGDKRLYVSFVGADSAIYGDVLGAMETRVLLAEARGSDGLLDPSVPGWGGDRFELYHSSDGDALIWIAAFDTPPARDGALRALTNWPHARAGYLRQLDAIEVSGKAGVRFTIAPTGWKGWTRLPTATASTTAN